MNSKSIIALAVAFFIGVIHEFLKTDSSDMNVVYFIGNLIGGGFNFIILVGSIPAFLVIVSTIKYKIFPNKTFTILMYVMVAVVVSLIVYGKYVTSSLLL